VEVLVFPFQSYLVNGTKDYVALSGVSGWLEELERKFPQNPDFAVDSITKKQRIKDH
jgi:hypothetical protein